MTVAAAAPVPDVSERWRTNLPHVREALKYVKRRGHVTAEELVEWDRRHGRRLFNWEDPEAAEEWRKQQARLFLNRFRQQFDGMRVRAFIHVKEDADKGVERDAYYTIETIAQHRGMREQVIGDVTRRITSLSSELAMWRLSDAEQEALFARQREAMAAYVG